MICGACERELPEGAYSGEQRGRRQSIRRCEECVAAGNQLVLMKKGRTRSEEDECPICNLPLPLDVRQSMLQAVLHEVGVQWLHFGSSQTRHDGLSFLPGTTPDDEPSLAMIQKRVDAGDPMAIYHLGINITRTARFGEGRDEGRRTVRARRRARCKRSALRSRLFCMMREQTWRKTRPRRSDITRQQR